MIDRSGIFAVNILTPEMTELAKVFSDNGRPEAERFRGVQYHTASTGAPILDENMGWIECQVTYRYAGGDHTIFVGEVVNAGERLGNPLVFWRGQYIKLRP
jgi:flavin reductase (DIM6/NTAB) family NADH-FMN oxidoreductase RutF